MTEEQRVRDAIVHTQEMLYGGSLTAFQKEKITVLMRMSYYLGVLDESKNHDAVMKLLNGGDEE